LTLEIPVAGCNKSDESNASHSITAEGVSGFPKVMKSWERIKVFGDYVRDRLVRIHQIDFVVDALRSALDELNMNVAAGARKFNTELLIDIIGHRGTFLAA
jgi:hypothetical protein